MMKMNKKIIGLSAISMFLALSIFSSINAVAVDPDDIHVKFEGMFRRSGLFGVRIRSGLHIEFYNAGDETFDMLIDAEIVDSAGNNLIPDPINDLPPIFPYSRPNMGPDDYFGLGFHLEKGFGSFTIKVFVKDASTGETIKEVTAEGSRLYRFIVI
jgi:hypothetical protein